jgi:hypothetical protein
MNMAKKYFDALDNILDKPIAFNPSFKKITGSTNAALLLSQAFYWTKRASLPDGWFWKTRDEWMEETGLTEAELDGAREKCRATGVMEEKLKGVPATLHYRVVKSKVYELLGFQFPEVPDTGLPENPQIPENPESGSNGDFNKESETPSENTPARGKKGDLVDGVLFFAGKAKEQQADKVEELIQELERGLRVNIARTTKNQQTAKRILKDARPIARWIAWAMADEWRASHLYLYADLEKVWRDFPQAFPAEAPQTSDGKRASSFYA